MAEPIILNPTPKQQVTANSKRIALHRAVVETTGFQDAINMGLLQYQRMLAESTVDSNVAAASMFKLKGAQEFVQVLIHLTHHTSIKTESKIAQLDHNA